MKGSKTSTDTSTTHSNASNLNASNIAINTDTSTPTSTTISGSNVIATDTLNITTHDLIVQASKDTTSSNSDSKQINGSVSLSVYGGGASGASLGYGENHANSESETNHNSNLNANTMNINVANDANFKGATVRADDTLNLTVGNNLNVESVRDSSTSASHGMNASLGVSAGGNNTALSGANASIGSNNSRSSEKQTVLTSLTGDSVNITVGENTNLKGSLIAAGGTDATGVFQDNKNLNLSTKTLTFENSTNTKSSNSSGFGIGAGVNPQGDISSVSTQLSTGTTYERTKTLATLGQGNVNITDQANSDDLARLNTDTTQVDKSLFKTDTGTSVSATLDTRLLTSEGRAQIAADAKKAKEHGEDIANGVITVATNDKIDITNIVETVRDNTSTTKLKDYLTQTKEGEQILKGLQADPQSQEYHDAQIAANQKLQEFRGLEVEKAVYYDAKATTNEKLKDTTSYDAKTDTLTQKDTQGATITKGDSTGTILLDVSGNAQNLSSKQNDTVASGHEVGEEKYLQNGYGTFFTDSYDTKEAMNDTYGAYYAQRLNEATNGGISDVPYATNTNTPSITTGTNIANGMIIPENGVEYRQVNYDPWMNVALGTNPQPDFKPLKKAYINTLKATNYGAIALSVGAATSPDTDVVWAFPAAVVGLSTEFLLYLAGEKKNPETYVRQGMIDAIPAEGGKATMIKEAAKQVVEITQNK